MRETSRNLSFDGLRGVAVLAVLLYHHHLLNMGWAGVDLFFVLSGFLITSILRRSRNDEHYWREFWVKRVTRIFPPLLLVLTFVEIRYRLPVPRLLAYLASFGDLLAYVHGRFEPTRPLWSLAVEEHFYLLWPVFVRFCSRGRLIVLLLVLVLVEPLLRAGISIIFKPDWSFVYFLTPFRLDGLSLGCLLALWAEDPVSRARLQRFSGLGTIVGVGLFIAVRGALGVRFTREGNTPVYNAVVYTIVALIALFFIAYLLTAPLSFPSRALAWRPVVFLGTISYGLYLYQVPIRELLIEQFRLSARFTFLLCLPLATCLAWLSFRFIEEPLILWGKRLARSYRRVTDSSVEVSVSTAP